MLQSQLEQQSKAVDTIIGNMRVGACHLYCREIVGSAVQGGHHHRQHAGVCSCYSGGTGIFWNITR